MDEHKVLVCGGDGVGKSALTIQFAHHYFASEFDPFKEETHRKEAMIDGLACELEIDVISEYDSADLYRGHERNIDESLRNAHGFICAYSVTSRTSFQRVARMVEKIVRKLDRDDWPNVLVGTKCDLEQEREVAEQEGQDLAASLKCSFFETSALAAINIEEAFYELVREIRRHQLENYSPQPYTQIQARHRRRRL
jgi:GTPase KRas